MAGNLPELAADIAADVGEVLADARLAEGLIRDLPVLGTLVKFARAGQSASDALLLTRIRRFLRRVDEVDPDERAAFAYDPQRDADFRAQVSETLAFALDRADELDKAEIIAAVFRALVRRRIDVTTFRRITGAVNQSFAPDLRAAADAVGRGHVLNADLLRRLLPSGLAQLPATTSTAVYPDSVDLPLEPELSASGRTLAEVLSGA